ncbi:hypothetical protein NPIL_14101 [Nephila pilipes]|uniref:Uncharacterized protein n=1 Tax=Nephila pilipes TaxID=299642 RepID=A0A8X6I6P5_NEPPI|nr:hypothetical protein NPIL_14101 [Nephila pilipes]
MNMALRSDRLGVAKWEENPRFAAIVWNNTEAEAGGTSSAVLALKNFLKKDQLLTTFLETERKQTKLKTDR